jgi:NAD(P)-dependent dehydrogenase (short-subunit alcohol dehydrogenase family)
MMAASYAFRSTFTANPMDTGSTVVLTGVGAKGQVGEVVARAFAELGASLVLVDRTLANVAERAAELTSGGYAARGYACDLTDAAAVTSLVGEVRRNHGDKIHALVHMAGGFGMSGPVAESSLDIWNRQIAINLTTAYLATRAFLPMLRAARGSIVLFASEAALPGATGKNRSAYAVAKTGVVTLMHSIANEERKLGVRANAIAPTSIRTAVNVAAMGEDAHYIEREQVAAVVTFLCSDAASAISGELLPLT